MRVYTLVLSILVHVVAIGALIVVPLIATDVLPEPRRAVQFIEITPIDIEPPPPPVQRRAQQNTPPVSPNAAPVDAPVGVEPEPEFVTAATRTLVLHHRRTAPAWRYRGVHSPATASGPQDAGAGRWIDPPA